MRRLNLGGEAAARRPGQSIEDPIHYVSAGSLRSGPLATAPRAGFRREGRGKRQENHLPDREGPGAEVPLPGGLSWEGMSVAHRWGVPLPDPRCLS